MSQENVEIVERAVDAFNQRDVEAALAELVSPDFVWFPPRRAAACEPILTASLAGR